MKASNPLYSIVELARCPSNQTISTHSTTISNKVMKLLYLLSILLSLILFFVQLLVSLLHQLFSYTHECLFNLQWITNGIHILTFWHWSRRNPSCELGHNLEPIAFVEQSYLFSADLFEFIYIGFVAKQQQKHILVRVTLNFIQPKFLDILEGLLTSCVVDDHDATNMHP